MVDLLNELYAEPLRLIPVVERGVADVLLRGPEQADACHRSRSARISARASLAETDSISPARYS